MRVDADAGELVASPVDIAGHEGHVRKGSKKIEMTNKPARYGVESDETRFADDLLPFRSAPIYDIHEWEGLCGPSCQTTEEKLAAMTYHR
jgi:hypothetical protein